MKGLFECRSCTKLFEAEGTKDEWIDPVVGPCFKYVAGCPDCKSICAEFRKPKQGKEKHMHAGPCGNCCHGGQCGV